MQTVLQECEVRSFGKLFLTIFVYRKVTATVTKGEEGNVEEEGVRNRRAGEQ